MTGFDEKTASYCGIPELRLLPRNAWTLEGWKSGPALERCRPQFGACWSAGVANGRSTSRRRGQRARGGVSRRGSRGSRSTCSFFRGLLLHREVGGGEGGYGGRWDKTFPDPIRYSCWLFSVRSESSINLSSRELLHYLTSAALPSPKTVLVGRQAWKCVKLLGREGAMRRPKYDVRRYPIFL